MKFEIKKIDLTSIVFSGFSVTLFFVSVFVATVAIFITPSPVWIGESVRSKLIGAFIYTLTFYIITLAYIIFLVFIYNLFVSLFGLRGIKVEIEEKE